MHCQLKEGEIGPFWDIESLNIQILAQKGLGVEFMFGFDWHWRAETSARGRGGCSTNHWTEALRNLHDTLSSDLLKILPLLLLIVAGGVRECRTVKPCQPELDVSKLFLRQILL